MRWHPETSPCLPHGCQKAVYLCPWGQPGSCAPQLSPLCSGTESKPWSHAKVLLSDASGSTRIHRVSNKITKIKGSKAPRRGFRGNNVLGLLAVWVLKKKKSQWKKIGKVNGKVQHSLMKTKNQNSKRSEVLGIERSIVNLMEYLHKCCYFALSGWEKDRHPVSAHLVSTGSLSQCNKARRESKKQKDWKGRNKIIATCNDTNIQSKL